VKDIVIAIDGYAACGKSSTAKAVATKLNYLYIDSGAMYRAVALYFLAQRISFDKENPGMLAALENIHIDFVQKAGQKYPSVRLNGLEVEHKIRKPEVTNIVSQVSVHSSVRRALVLQQQRMGEGKRVVMDGRDIGTVVFPDAELKIFMTASLEARTKRRQSELQAQGVVQKEEEISTSLSSRDHIDSTRKVGPLKQDEDAVVIDTTSMSFKDQVQKVVDLAHQKMKEEEVGA